MYNTDLNMNEIKEGSHMWFDYDTGVFSKIEKVTQVWLAI